MPTFVAVWSPLQLPFVWSGVKGVLPLAGGLAFSHTGAVVAMKSNPKIHKGMSHGIWTAS